MTTLAITCPSCQHVWDIEAPAIPWRALPASVRVRCPSCQATIRVMVQAKEGQVHISFRVELQGNEAMEEQVKRVHENLKQLTFIKTGETHHPLYVRIQTPDRVDIGLWLDRWQTVDVVSWLQSLVSHESMVGIANWPTILDIVESGIEGDKEKCRGYAELWLEKLRADGETRIAQSLERILEGRKGQVIHLAQEKSDES